MEENKVTQMTKHTDSSRSTDSGVSGNAQTGARESRFKHDCDSCLWLGQFEKYDLYACSQGGTLATIIARYGDKGEQYVSGIGIDILAIREGSRRAVLAAIKSISECSRLASRVEELENLIAKRYGCSHCNDSASGGIDK